MNTMKKILKSLTLAALFAVGASAFAVGGDIYEIRPCTQEGVTTNAYASATQPMTAGETIYFNVRLIRRMRNVETTTWYIEHVGYGSKVVDDALYPMQIGIYVSGQLRYATLVDTKINKTTGFTDLIFSYKTNPGDYALPIVLATESGPATTSDGSIAYLLNRTDKWAIMNEAGNTCNFTFWSAEGYGQVTAPENGSPKADYTLAECGFYVRSINFDSAWEQEGTLWRSVHENSTITVGTTPKLEAVAPVEDAVTLHVWSTDDSAVKIHGGREVDIVQNNAGDKVKTVVGDITIAGGQTYADFSIEGVKEGESCYLVLSPWDNFSYSPATGARIENFIKVPVKCIEPMPLTLQVAADRQIAYANGNFDSPAAELALSLTQAHTNDITFTLNVKFQDTTVDASEWSNYLRFDTTQEPQEVPPAATIPTFTIKAGSLKPVESLYLFALRGDSHTTGAGHQVIFEPVFVSGGDDVKTTTGAIYISAEAPVITTPSEGAVISGTCGDDIPFTLAVSDTYADLSDRTTGYKVFIKYRASDAFKQLDGVYYAGENNVLYLLQDDGAGGFIETQVAPILNYPAAGQGIESQVYVVAPVSGKKSEFRNFLANIAEARTSTVDTIDPETGSASRSFNEGAEVQFNITISEKNDTGNTIYAFLKPSNNADIEMFAAETPFIIGMPNPEGLPIGKYQDSIEGIIQILDGKSKKAGGLKIGFEVVLSTDINDPTKTIAGYDSNYITVTVYNVEPLIKRIEMNGNESEHDGYTYPNRLPMGINQKFVAWVEDDGEYDLTTTIEEKKFYTKWTAYLDGAAYQDPVIIRGDPRETANAFSFDFPAAGNWTIKAQVKDKDMSDWSAVSYSVNVTVLDQPTVEMSEMGTIYENDLKSTELNVSLAYFDPKFSGKVYVAVKVSQWTPKANPGKLILDNAFAWADPFEVTVDDAGNVTRKAADPDAQYYIVELSKTRLQQTIKLQELDGTEASDSSGFRVTSYVAYADPDAALPTSNTKAEVYYISTEQQVYVVNVEPVLTSNTKIENTESNAWNCASIATDYPINWGVKSDVQADWDGKIKVSFSGCANAAEGYQELTAPGNGSFIPNFGANQGLQIVIMTVEDKDGGIVTRTYYFNVQPSKYLVTYANGPSGGRATDATSQRYSRASGIGAGHVWTTSGKAGSAENFSISWNCSKETDVNLYGFGYKYNDNDYDAGLPVNPGWDDGNLNNQWDVALTQAGSIWSDASGLPCFSYKLWLAPTTDDDKKDSFLYGWLTPASEGGESAATSFTMFIAPEVANKMAAAQVALPNSVTGDGNYVKTVAEAIFSREYLPADNLGDINQDGIPDYYAVKDDWKGGKLIALTYGAEDTEGDLQSLAASNTDLDYMPGVLVDDDRPALVDGSQASYAPVGFKFDAKLELRGMDDGLNDPDNTIAVSDISLSEDEAKAREWWYNNLASDEVKGQYATPADLPLAVWSPEPGQNQNIKHMDPTVEDTDGDGFPDGWEYYFWYVAKVWGPAETVKPLDGQTYVFEKFQPPTDVLLGLEIPYAEVMEYFNPVVPRTKEQLKDRPDFDNDGLSDLEELAIGTNPCHWDSDGDHMCDGWEVMMALDPLGRDRKGNPDGDYFALFETLGMLAYPTDNSGLENLAVPGKTYWFDLSGDYLGPKGQGLYWDYEIEGEGEDIVMCAVALQDITTKFLAVTNMRDPHHDDDTIYCYGWRADNPGDETRWGAWLTNRRNYEWVEGTIPAGAILPMTVNFAFIHDQVLDLFGFDPRTGWYEGNADGYLSGRWPINNNGMDVTGVAVNTAKYCNFDEYLTMRYRLDFGILYPDEKYPDWKKVWASIRSLATQPTVTQAKVTQTEVAGEVDENGEAGEPTVVEETEETTTTMLAKAITEALAQIGSEKTVVIGHGADTDADGVPDGWELYVYRNPCAGPGELESKMVVFQGIGSELATDIDDDGLTYAMEFAGTDSCNVYKDCESIYKNHPGNTKGWFNKFFPTDPSSSAVLGMPSTRNGQDTDGDGIVDGMEGQPWAGAFPNGGNIYLFTPDDPGFTFIYGTPTDDNSHCIRGGGMNPLSTDTDLDGLPDAWEVAYAGVAMNASTHEYVGPSKTKPDCDDPTWVADGVLTGGRDVAYIAGGLDATWAGDAWTDPLNYSPDGGGGEGGNSYDKVLGTWRDVDFDHDGLQNYQEYLMQTVRHFRYDDITTPLMGRLFEEAGHAVGGACQFHITGRHTQKFMDFIPMEQSAENMAVNAATAWYGIETLEVVTVTNSIAVTTNQFSNSVVTNYLTTVTTNVLDGAAEVRKHQVASRLNHEFSTTWTPEGWKALGYMSTVPHAWDMLTASHTITPYVLYVPAGATSYICTDPRLFDTDGDGMDDYYEMFHGLNPLLGSTTPGGSDVVASAFGQPTLFNAFWNEWTHPDYCRVCAMQRLVPTAVLGEAASAPQALDPVMYPWVMGAKEVDADGDGLRNHEESILANVASPTPTHTDPTPAWFTDSSTAKSYVSQYYPLSYPVSSLPFWPNMIGFDDEYYLASVSGGVFRYLTSFEENEGYDTDNDWVPDGREIIKTTRQTTDPINFSDPDRRQAMWFDGVNSYCITKDIQSRAMDAVDTLKQFTVECWVRPEKTGVAQTIVERSSYYSGSSLTGLGGVIRANFRIGLSEDGRIYGLFDNSDSIESGLNQPVSCQRVDGQRLQLDKWSHVALTYNGEKLILYVNGAVADVANTTLIPANGVTWIGQNPATTNAFTATLYQRLPNALFVGARPQHFAGADNIGSRPLPLYAYYVDGEGNHLESFDNYREFFQGYVDEVRIWDGARSGTDIYNNYQGRMSFKDVADNRDTVYMSWILGATRNNNDGKPTLPCELMMHYNFVTMPGAVKAADVAKIPSGFHKNVEGAAANRYNGVANTDIDLTGLTDPKGLKGVENSYDLKDGIKLTWWDTCVTRSQVYADTRVIPWVENTVTHLPEMDGSCLDSFFYSDYLGGLYTPADLHGLDKFTFPNTAVPYHATMYYLERYVRLFCMNKLVEAYGESYEALRDKFDYELHYHFDGTSDLLPMGGAYAKTCPEMWDGAVAASWEYTGDDSNDNGVPDWWEQYACENYMDDPFATLDWDTTINYNGAAISAYMGYLIDLAMGMQPDGTYDPTYAANNIDMDGDNLPDWWESIFGVAEYGADDDPDNDGLSNYAEYILSFGNAPYGMANGFQLLNPLSPRSGIDQLVTDYFLFNTNDVSQIEGNKNFEHFSNHEYYGEITTDHDFMEIWWEKKYSNGYVSASIYDPLDDKDEDGWSNFAECRYILWTGSYVADLVDRYLDGNNDNHVNCYPQPAIGLRLTYHGSQNVTGAGVVLRTTTGTSPRWDSTFVVPGGAQDPVDAVHFIGANNGVKKIHGFLNPGSVVPGDATFEMATLASDRNYRWRYTFDGQTWSATRGTYAEYRAALLRYGSKNVELEDAEVEWEVFAKSYSDADGRKGEIILQSTNVTSVAILGTIDYRSGEYSIDLSKMEDAGLDLDGAVFHCVYSSRIGNEWPQTLYFSEATAGRVKEGSNTLEVFLDLDGDGAFTPGEPYGMLQNVPISWHKTPVYTVELTDESPFIARTTIAAAAAGGEEGGEEATAAAAAEDNGRTMKVVVRRKGINGETVIDGKTVPVRSLATRTIVLDDRAYLTEADVISSSTLDLDWKWLVKDATKLGITMTDLLSANYDIEQVTELLDGTKTYSVIASFANTFTASRAMAVTLRPALDTPVYSARPTFTFSSGDSTMKAYQLQVSTTTNATGIIYDSGMLTLPGRTGLTVGTSVYEAKLPLYVDCSVTTNGAAVFNDVSNYYWRVALLNSKFNSTEDSTCWTDWASFQMDVDNVNRYPKQPTGYGNCAAVVRYYGPCSVTNGTIVVEAFENADFTGDPLARKRLDNIEQLADITDITTTNVVLKGVEPGTVYLRAYIDANNNNKRDNWEPWGYANNIGSDDIALYTPAGLTVTDAFNKFPTAAIYIEDCDTNRNEIPDCLEDSFLATVSAGGGTTVTEDGDKDGIKNEDEDNYGTQSSMWDTDSDGMPDGWEALFADLDPNFPDADEAADDDVMAFAVTNATVVTIRANKEGADAKNYILAAGAEIPFVGDNAEGLELYSIYKYPVWEDGKYVEYVGRGGLATIEVEEGYENRVAAVKTETVAYVHAQVYQVFGFDPNTAVVSENAVNTKPFTALDKYLVSRYLESLGICSEEQMNLDNAWSKYTLRPYTTDFDEDGMSDGWELYVMFGPNDMNVTTFTNGTAISPWNYEDRAGDGDADTLANYKEFNRGLQPTDPWNKYTVRDQLFASELLTGDPAEFDYLTDAVAKNFGVTPDKYLVDDDRDQVHNLGEMLGYYLDPTSLADIAIDNPFSDGVTPDYFRNFKEKGVLTYLGKRFNAAEFIEIEARKGLGMDALQGAGTASMATGWDYWSAARYGFANTTSNSTDVVSEDGLSTTTVWTVAHDFSGKIMPTMNLTLRYTGNETKNVVVQAFQVNPAYPERGEELQASWIVAAVFDGGVAKVQLETPNVGSLKQGKATFRAFIPAEGAVEGADAAQAAVGDDAQGQDVEQIAEFTYDATYGSAETEVGWKGGSLTISLGDPNEALPVIPLEKDGDIYQTIAIVRTMVNGQRITPRGVVLRKYWNNINRDCIYPDEFVSADYIGLDKYLAEEAVDGKDPAEDEILAVENVTYEIVRIRASQVVGLDEDEAKISVTNLNHYTFEVIDEETNESTIQTVDQTVNEEFTVRYSLERDIAEGIVLASSLEGDVAFGFKVPTDGFAYTKFWLYVDNRLYGENRGFVMPSPIAGVVVLDLADYGINLGQGEHTIQVALGNDKFPKPSANGGDEWSPVATVKVNAAKSFDGKLAVMVKHPLATFADGVTVAVYESEDLVNPVMTVVNKASDEAIELEGLRENGTYYLAAWYVKDVADGRESASERKPYDTWGYLTKLGLIETGFDALGVKASAKLSVTNVVWMQDTDWNDNGVLDREEEFKAINGEFDPESPEHSDLDCDGVIDSDDSDPVFDNGEESVERDVMAYAVEKMYCVAIGTNADEVVWYVVSEYENEAEKLSHDVDGIRNGVLAKNISSLMSTYYYTGKAKGGLGLGTNVTFTADERVFDYGWKDIILVHAQVYDRYGFNPLTANGCIGTNEWVNTKAFTSKDKYCVTNYLAAIGADAAGLNRSLKAKVLDYDYDGINDGWELYVMFGPAGTAANTTSVDDAVHSPWNYDDRAADVDADGLTQYREYDAGLWPTDPWDGSSMQKYLQAIGAIDATVPAFTDSEFKKFDVTADGVDDDDDLDQISAWNEMLAYLYDKTTLADICVTNAWSDGTTPDYFRSFTKNGTLTYLGAEYNGAEFIEPWNMEAVGLAGMSQCGTRDVLNAGWDLWSVIRYSLVQMNKVGDSTVSEELTLIIKYLDVVVPGEFTGSTLEEVREFVHTTWKGVTHGTVNGGSIDCESCVTTDDIISFFWGRDYMEYIVAVNAPALTAADIEIPSASVNMTLKYAGNDTLTATILAYQTSSQYPERGEQVVARWTVTANFDAGVAKLTLGDAASGSLKQGKVRFVAYFDADGSVDFSAADPFGMASTTLGYLGADVTIRIGDPNAALPILTLTDPNAGLADASNSVDAVQTIAIVRTKVNGRSILNGDILDMDKIRGVSLRRYYNNVNRDALYPFYYMDGDQFVGLDKYLADDLEDSFYGEGLDSENIESVTYEIIRLPADLAVEQDVDVWQICMTNLNDFVWISPQLDEDGNQAYDEEGNELYVTNTPATVGIQNNNEEFTVYYSLRRDVAREVRANAASTEGNVEVTFTVPTDKAVTRFWFEIIGDATASGEGMLPNATAGRVTFDPADYGVSLAPGAYSISICLGNDKFPEAGVSDEEWSAPAKFNVNAAASRKGRIDVVVKHPTVDLDSKLVIAAYEKADLAAPCVAYVDQPAGEVVSITNLRENASYYVAAWYVKNADDGREAATDRMPYDTWGYVTSLGKSANGFDSHAVKAVAVPAVTNYVFVQDTDWNDNGVLDREEDIVSVMGYTPAVGPDDADLDADGIPDGEEVDPIKDNSRDTLEGDVMAYAVVSNVLCVQIGSVPDSSTWTWYIVQEPTAETTTNKLTGDVIYIPRGTPASELKTLATTYQYGRKKSAPYGLGTNVTLTAGTVYNYDYKDIVLVHAQVYEHFGFDPNTANALIEESQWVNTKKFTSSDKYFVTNYLAAVGAVTTGNWSEWTLSAKRVDFEYDGITDGWELYTMFGPAGTINGAKLLTKDPDAAVINPWVFDDRTLDADSDGLDNLHEYDAGVWPTDPWSKDTNADGIDDMVAFKYHLKGNMFMADADGDGLCNYVEYLLSEVFDLGVKFDPDNAYSIDPFNIDYFYQIGSLYAGEIFTDNDMIEDDWEDLVGSAIANRYAWDQLADNDDDGWTNFDERRYRDFAAADPNNTNALSTTGIAGHPTPTLKVTLHYNGKQVLTGGAAEENGGKGNDEETTGVTYAPVILMTYTDADMVVPDAVYTANPTASFHSGKQTLEFTEPLSGYVRSGRNAIVALIDLDGDGGYTPGEPLGYVRGVNVGWYGTATEIEMTDVSPIITRADLTTGESDRHVLYGTEDGDNRNLYSGALSGGKYERIRVIRTLVNGWGVDQLKMANRVVIDKYIELDQRPFFFEGDVLGDNEFDLDWAGFDREVLRNSNIVSAGIDPTNVTYRIVLGNGTIDTTATNNLFQLATVRHYDRADNRTRPTAVAPGSEGSIVYAAHPTFKWSMGGINSYTAFRIQIRSGSVVVWDSGLQRTPPMASDGTYTYEAEAYVGEVLANDQNYTWRVSMYNAKFQSDWWSQGTPTFRMSAPNDGYVLGKIPVCVKYFGPSAALGISTVRVAAYTTPDFSGTPVARTVATTTNLQKANVAHKANAELLGLPKGRYYVCAYLDANRVGKQYSRDSFESWGYACPREKDLRNPFKPYTVLVDDTGAVSEVIDVYIEDSDTNGNSLPDLWEFAANGSLYEGTQAIDNVVPGNAAIKASLTANLQSKVTAAATTGGLTAMVTTVMSSREIAALAMGVEPSALSVNAAGVVTVESEVDTVTISSIGFEDGKLVIKVDGTQKELATGLYGALETAPTEVTCVVYHKDTLEAGWTRLQSQKVTIGADAQAIALPEDSGTSGFYKVVIEQ